MLSEYVQNHPRTLAEIVAHTFIAYTLSLYDLV
jgi:hypothetical protein